LPAGELCLFSATARPVLGASQLPIEWTLEASYPGGELSPPCALTAWYLIKHRKNFAVLSYLP